MGLKAVWRLLPLFCLIERQKLYFEIALLIKEPSIDKMYKISTLFTFNDEKKMMKTFKL